MLSPSAHSVGGINGGAQKKTYKIGQVLRNETIGMHVQR